MVGTASLLLWKVLTDAYARLGFDVIGDEAFKAMVLGRIVEPTSKADTLPRVLGEIGVEGPSLRTVFRALARCMTGTTAAAWPRPAWRIRPDAGWAGVVGHV